MKIIGRYKDYYDYQATIYGFDPLITYDRKNPGETHFTTEYNFDKEIYTNDLHYVNDISNTADFKFLVVCGKAFPIHGSIYDSSALWELVTINHKTIQEAATKRYFNESHVKQVLNSFTINQPINEALLEFSKHIGHPVFILCGRHYNRKLNNYEYLVYDRYVPMKEIIGFPGIYPPDQMYQDITHWFTSQVKDTPAEMSNEVKLQSAGFDKRVSFRHR